MSPDSSVPVATTAPDLGTLPDIDWPAVAASAICLIFSVGTITLYSFGVFIRPLAHDFGWTRGQLSAAVAISQYALAVAAPVWGYLTDRFGPRAAVLPSVVRLSAGVASLAFLTPHLWHFYLIFALIPFLGGAASPIGYATVLIRRFDRQLGLALGLALMGVGIGAAVLPPLAQALIAGAGWRQAYLVLGVLTLVVTFPAAMVATRYARGPAAHRGSGEVVPVAPLVFTSTFAMLSATFLLLGMVSVGAVASLVPMLGDRGFSAAGAAAVAGLSGLATIASRGGIGWFLDRVHAPHLLGMICLFAACSMLLLLYGPGSLSVYLAALLLGTVAGAEVDFIAFLVRRYFGQAAFGRLYGIAFSVFIVGAGTGPLLLGILFDHSHSYRVGLLAFVLLMATAAAITFSMPRYARPGQIAASPPPLAA